MKRLKLKHGYHDATLNAIRYEGNADISFDVNLCSCCNPVSGPATVNFLGVRNYGFVKDVLEAVLRTQSGRRHIDEIIGIERHTERGFIVDLAVAGGLHIDARGLYES